jgi:glyoxylase-like metal-dependent hydrolase (beta-lactamase superfamily II)
MENPETARAAILALRQHCSKPIVALIYTHFHQDHVGGANAYLEFAPPNGQCDIYAHDLTSTFLKRYLGKTGTVANIRALRQFGPKLPDSDFINSGIGPCLGFNEDTVVSIPPPTITVSKELLVDIEGIRVHILHAPGETDDQIVVFLPDKQVLCAADNIYKAFPNLYAIRGTPSRDAHQWASSLEMMRQLGAAYLVPSHTRPVVGRETINQLIATYRDAIMFVHDQTVRYMNKGFFLDDIVSRVVLPPHLISHPYLQVCRLGVRGGRESGRGVERGRMGNDYMICPALLIFDMFLSTFPSSVLISAHHILYHPYTHAHPHTHAGVLWHCGMERPWNFHYLSGLVRRRSRSPPPPSPPRICSTNGLPCRGSDIPPQHRTSHSTRRGKGCTVGFTLLTECFKRRSYWGGGREAGEDDNG